MTAFGFAAVAIGADASSPAPAAAAPCDTPQHHQFDFWVGDWQVFDATTRRLVGFDRVEKHSHGCIVKENLNFIRDRYRRPACRAGWPESA
jgi:hypothetical protein